jgi:hypothetical protein
LHCPSGYEFLKEGPRPFVTLHFPVELLNFLLALLFIPVAELGTYILFFYLEHKYFIVYAVIWDVAGCISQDNGRR